MVAYYNLYRTSTVSQDEIESPVTSCRLYLLSYFPGLLGPVHDFILSWLEQFVAKFLRPTGCTPMPKTQ
jgi:hypothetical protein